MRRRFVIQEQARGDDVAQVFTIEGGKGRVGFIASLTESFCDQCSRLRLTANGALRSCLFSTDEVPLRHLLRQQAADEEIVAAIRHAVATKPRGNWFRDHPLNRPGPAESAPFSAYTSAAGPLIRSLGG